MGTKRSVRTETLDWEYTHLKDWIYAKNPAFDLKYDILSILNEKKSVYNMFNYICENTKPQTQAHAPLQSLIHLQTVQTHTLSQSSVQTALNKPWRFYCTSGRERRALSWHGPVATASWPQLSLSNTAWTLSVITCTVTALHYSWKAYNSRWRCVCVTQLVEGFCCRNGVYAERSSKINFDKWRLYSALDRSSGKTPG